MRIRTLVIGTVMGCLVISVACSLEPPKHGHQTASYTPATSKHKAVAIAQQMLGTPYHYGGSSPQQGFDCSGLVYYSYSKAGYHVARDSDGQYEQTIPIDPRDLQPGDLLFYNIDGKNGHVGIYVGDGQFIHAPSTGKRVSYASMHNKYWRDRFVRAGRLK